MKYIRIIADTNDADYIEAFNVIEEEVLNKILPLINGIKEFKPYEVIDKNSQKRIHRHNYPTYDVRTDMGEKYPFQIYENICSEKIISLFEQYIPYGEYGIHTITSIEIFEVTNVEKLL